MLVDNAVVGLENIFRHYESGDDPVTAAVKGTQEVWGAVVASTLTTLAVFLPVLFVAEEAGQLFRDIALAISAAVGLSLLVSVTVIPTASSRLLRRTVSSEQGSLDSDLPPDDANFFVRAIVGLNQWAQASWGRQVSVVVGLFALSLLVTFSLTCVVGCFCLRAVMNVRLLLPDRAS